MTIRKGEKWGRRGEVPPGTPTAPDDAGLAQLVYQLLESDGSVPVAPSEPPMARVATGDLLGTVGGGGGLRSSNGQLLPMDLGLVRLESGEEYPFVACVLAHRRGWRGQAVAVMNAAWHGDWYLGPRAHPNDGLLDITSGSLPWRERLLALQRVKSGSHLPHPDLETRRVPSWSCQLDRPLRIHIDGIEVATSQTLDVRLISDAFVLVV